MFLLFGSYLLTKLGLPFWLFFIYESMHLHRFDSRVQCNGCREGAMKDEPLEAQKSASQRLQREYAELVRTVMHERSISVRKLYDNGIIRKCTARAFDDRLRGGEISTGEFNALLQYLGVDRMRATLALIGLHDPNAYFDPTCKTASYLAVETAITLHEQIAACEGDFEPIRLSLCRSLAERMSGLIVEHHKRIEEARTATFC